MIKGSPLGELARIRNVLTRRVSSYDRTGGNDDGFSGKYTVTILGIVRLLGLLTAVPLLACIVWQFRNLYWRPPAPTQQP